MASNEEYLDSLLKAVDADEASEKNALEKLGAVAEQEKTIGEEQAAAEPLAQDAAETIEKESLNEKGIGELEQLLKSAENEAAEAEANTLEDETEKAEAQPPAEEAEMPMEEAEPAELEITEAVPVEAMTAEEDMLTDLGDKDVTDILDEMSEDEDLAEINELLKKSDNNEAIDEDVLALLENAEAENNRSAEEAEESDGVQMYGIDPERRDQAGGDGESIASQDTADNADGDSGEKGAKKGRKKREKKEKGERKPGFLSKILNLLTEEDEEPLEPDGESQQLKLSNENQEIIDSLNKEEEKKKKKEKKKKEKKPPKPKKEKTKKPKKVKEKKEEEPEKPEKKLGRKRIIATVLFSVTVFGAVMIFAQFIPGYVAKKDGLLAFEQGDFEKAYGALLAQRRNEEEEAAFQGAEMYLLMERQLESYQNYSKMQGWELQQLNALLLGVQKYQRIKDRSQSYGVQEQVTNVYLNIISLLESQYGISEEEAVSLSAIRDRVEYTVTLKGILGQEISGVQMETEEGLDDSDY